MGLQSTVLSVAVVLTVLFSLFVVRRIDRPEGRWGRHLRSRFVLGVPWGTLLVSVFVLSVYLFVQGGLDHWSRPTTLPYRAWSFFYPTGMLAAAFSHDGPGHLIGNLTGTLVLGTLAEYAWGHFPRDRGSRSFGTWRTNPWVRALVVFPAVAVLAGLVGVVLSIGPVIGFSGVVFAFGGFALARYPLGTIVGLTASGALGTVYNALRNPVVTATAQPSGPSPPWWAGIAIQGHAVGLLIGVLVGAYVFGRRDETPPAIRLWAGVGLFGMSRALWAVYWFRGSDTFVLYRGLGIVLVATLALLVTAGLAASDRPIADRLSRLLTPGGGGGPARTVEVDGGSSGDDERTVSEAVREASWRQVALVVLVVSFGVLGGPGIGSNLFAAAGTDTPEESVSVRDYDVFYAEGVTNRMVAVVDVSAFNESTQVEASGVIVASGQRRIWQEAVPASRLAYDGQVRVGLGGLGWRSSVVATRRGWSATGGGAAYRVWLTPEGGTGEGRRVFNSSPATARPTIRGRNVSVLAPAGTDDFFLRVTRNNDSLGVVRIPDPGEVAQAGGLTFSHRDGSVYAIANATRVRVASKERYR